MERVAELTVQSVVVDRRIEIRYAMDDQYDGTIVVGLPEQPGYTREHLATLFDAWGGAFLAQLCLAESLHLPAGVDRSAWSVLEPVVQGLYDIRSYRDTLPLMAAPKVAGPELSMAPVASQPNERSAVLLWSGGVDSTLADLLLRANGFDTRAVHVQVNEGAIDGETDAVQALARHFGHQVEMVSFEFPQFLAIASTFSKVIDNFPTDNAIPHGRELLLIPIALSLGVNSGARFVALGHEYNAWTRSVEYLGRNVAKCDSQSERFNLIMDAYLKSYFDSDIALFSPVAPLSDYLKFRLLAEYDVEALGTTSACFWGRNCGVCGKCVLHYFLQRMLGLHALQFEEDSLGSQIAEDMVYRWDDRSQTNWREIHTALCAIVESGDFDQSEELIAFYSANVYSHIAGEIAAVAETLSRPQEVRLVPDGFHYAST